MRDNVVIIDTETGGLDSSYHSLISVGLVSACGKRTDEFIVRETPFISDPRSMAVHGITLEQIHEEGLSIADAISRFERFFEPNEGPVLLVGHNISFDLSFIKRLYKLADRPFPKKISHRSIDTHTLLWAGIQTGLFPATTNTSDGAFKHFNIEPPADKRHTALGDAIATQRLLIAILETYKNGQGTLEK